VIILHLLLSFIAGALLVHISNRMALLRWRRSTGQHWTERARLLFPVRTSATLNLIRVPAIVLLASTFFIPGDPRPLVGFAALLGAFAGSYTLDREIYPQLTPQSWLSLAVISFTFHLGLWVVPFAAAVLLPGEFSTSAILIIVGIVVFNVFVAMDGWIPVMRRLGIICPAPAEVARLVQEQASAKGIRLNGVWVVRVPASNAFASLFRGEVGFTSRFLETHPEPEIAAVASHELGHLTESRWARAGRLLTTFMLFPMVFMQPAVNALGLRGVAAVLLACFALLWFRGWLTRRMEVRADKFAVDGGADGAVYARALARLYETNQLPAVMPKRSRMPHPDLYDRTTAAGVMPDFPKPAPAKSWTWTGRLLTVGFVVLFLARIVADVEFQRYEVPPDVPSEMEAVEPTGQTTPAG
jgi:Zn-dependent protease with chaperone function